jgi:hypothetical protein
VLRVCGRSAITSNEQLAASGEQRMDQIHGGRDLSGKAGKQPRNFRVFAPDRIYSGQLPFSSLQLHNGHASLFLYSCNNDESVGSTTL